MGLDPLKTSVDHIAFEISLADFAAEKDRLERLGLAVTTAEHSWVHWRSLYVCGSREENPCQLGAVHTWRRSASTRHSSNTATFWGRADMLAVVSTRRK
jgi:hypothetical protein